MDKPHKKLDLWNAAMELAVAVYKITELFPKEERYSLTDQIRRAVSSVSSNVAEGAARQDTYLELSRRLGYLTQESWASLDKQV